MEPEFKMFSSSWMGPEGALSEFVANPATNRDLDVTF